MTWNQIMAVEDSLQTAGVFYNGFTGRRNCHSDSYGTCVDFAKLAEWQAGTPFPPEQLATCIEYWLGNPNYQPPLRLVALTLKRGLAPAI